MPETPYLPHIELFLAALRVNRERLGSRAKVAVDARLLKAMLSALAASQPFDPDFYRATNPDIDAAFQAGEIPDLHEHYIQSGFIEGRFGADPDVDEAYYLAENPDVAAAVKRGDLASGAEHYLRSGAAEGRIPSPALRPLIEAWSATLRDDQR